MAASLALPQALRFFLREYLKSKVYNNILAKQYSSSNSRHYSIAFPSLDCECTGQSARVFRKNHFGDIVFKKLNPRCNAIPIEIKINKNNVVFFTLNFQVKKIPTGHPLPRTTQKLHQIIYFFVHFTTKWRIHVYIDLICKIM